MKDWLFPDPPNTVVFTLKTILEKKEKILYVAHDDDDDDEWQFLNGVHVDMNNSATTSLSEILEIDPSLSQFYDLPLGFVAVRKNAESQWIRMQKY